MSSDSVLEISEDCTAAELVRALAAKGEAGYVLIDKKILEREQKRCEEIEKTTKSPLWREGARWNLALIQELLDSRKVKVVRKEAKA